MRIRFQADADLNQIIVAAALRHLREADFRSATETSLTGLHDHVLALAARDDRLLVTHDKNTMPTHFGEFITKTESPGVIAARQSLAVGRVLEDLALIWAASQAEVVRRNSVVEARSVRTSPCDADQTACRSGYRFIVYRWF